MADIQPIRNSINKAYWAAATNSADTDKHVLNFYIEGIKNPGAAMILEAEARANAQKTLKANISGVKCAAKKQFKRLWQNINERICCSESLNFFVLETFEEKLKEVYPRSLKLRNKIIKRIIKRGLKGI